MTNIPTNFHTPQKQHLISQSHTYSIASPIQTLSPNRRPPTVGKEQMDGSPQQKILKDLSSKVKHILKDSQKSTHQHTEDIMTLKRGNAEMQAIIDQFKNKSTFKPHLKEEYRLTVTEADLHSNSQIRDSSIIYSKRQVNSDHLNDSSSTLASLKRQLMTYINAAIQSNDQKMWKQQKYISSLQRRVSNLDQIQSKVQHFKFERAVKLQESPKKGKNFSMRTPPNMGDRVEEEDLKFQLGDNEKRQIKLLENPYKKNPQNAHNGTSQEHASLGKRFESLREQYALLKQRYDIQVETRVKEALENEALTQKIKYLSSQLQSNKLEIIALNQRLQLTQEKYADLEIFLHSHKSRISGKILPNIPASLSSELASIITELRVCGVDKYKSVERQINDILIENDYLRGEVGSLQGKVVEGCKFSCTHREVFLLKEKNHELSLQCQTLQKQLEEYQPSHAIKSIDKEEVNITLDKSRSTFGELQCAKWARLVHFCMASTMGRLQAIQKQLKAQSK